MTEVSEISGLYPKVKDLIFVYERNTSVSEPLEYFEGRQRSKSIGNALSYKQFRQLELEIHNIVDIEKELVKIEAHLNYYEVYQKETHVAFQEQLFNILTSIVSIDPEGLDSTVQKKKDLIEETQKLAKVLNAKLPHGSSQTHKNMKRSYSHLMRNEEAVVSSTSIKTQENKTTFSSSSSFLHNDFKSEESLNSTDHYSRQEESFSTDFSKLEEKPASTTPLPPINITSVSEGSYIPSVAKLKKFFSFRRDNKAEINVIPAAYSGVTRSQSLNLKTSKYNVFKRDNLQQTINTYSSDVTISENDEEIQDDNKRLITSSPLPIKNNDENEIHNEEIRLYNEPTEEIEEYRKNETQHNVSVSKLKSMFEEKRKENDEGLGLITKKQFRSDFSLPYTEANLGAFRLKRTISGNYMNFTGLLRSVEIQKKVELNKSKSLSDLKSDSLRYTIKDIEVDDLSKELDDNDDFGHVAINVGGKRTEEVNNNDVIEIESELGSGPAKKEHITSSSATRGLKHTFEPSTNNTEQKQNGNIKYDVHTTAGLISSKLPSEVISEVPVHVRADYSTADGFEEHIYEEEKAYVTTGVVESLKQTFEQITIEENNRDTKRTVHKTIEPVSSPAEESNESVQYKVNSLTDQVEEQTSEIMTKNEEKTHVNIGTVEALKQTFEQVNSKIEGQNNELSCSTNNSEKSLEEPVKSKSVFSTIDQAKEQKIVVGGEHASEEETRLTGTVEALKQTFERSNSESMKESTEDIKYPSPEFESASSLITSPNKLVLLEVPLRYRTDFSAVNRTEKQITEHVRTENNGQVEHVVRSAIETVSPSELKTEFSSFSSDEGQFKDNEDSNDNSSRVPVNLYNESYSTAEKTISSETNSSREQIASKTQSLMAILESPTSLSALVSNSSYSEGLQVSSLSNNVSASYSEKTSVQRTSSTYVSHQIVSSSSSAQSTEQLLSKNYLQVQQEPNSYSMLTSRRNPSGASNEKPEEDTITITEIEDSVDDDKTKKRVLSLNISQENILDEILDDSKEFENVEEEFEKILTGN